MNKVCNKKEYAVDAKPTAEQLAGELLDTLLQCQQSKFPLPDPPAQDMIDAVMQKAYKAGPTAPEAQWQLRGPKRPKVKAKAKAKGKAKAKAKAKAKPKAKPHPKAKAVRKAKLKKLSFKAFGERLEMRKLARGLLDYMEPPEPAHTEGPWEIYTRYPETMREIPRCLHPQTKPGQHSYTAPKTMASEKTIQVHVRARAFYVKPVMADDPKLIQPMKPDKFKGVHIAWARFDSTFDAAEYVSTLAERPFTRRAD